MMKKLTFLLVLLATLTPFSAYAATPNTLQGHGVTIYVAPTLGPTATSPEEGAQLQALIDTGNIIQGSNWLSVTDGVGTILYGHNPGPMAPIFHTIHPGARYLVTDGSGYSKTYEFHYVGERLPHQYNVERAWDGIDEALERTLHADNIVLVFCDYREMPQVWEGVPVDAPHIAHDPAPPVVEEPVVEDAPVEEVAPQPEPAPAPEPAPEIPAHIEQGLRNTMGMFNLEPSRIQWTKDFLYGFTDTKDMFNHH